MDGSDPRLLGEDERGDLWAPRGDGVWDRRFDGRRPSHWLPWLRSRLTMRLAMIEVGVPDAR